MMIKYDLRAMAESKIFHK